MENNENNVQNQEKKQKKGLPTPLVVIILIVVLIIGIVGGYLLSKNDNLFNKNETQSNNNNNNESQSQNNSNTDNSNKDDNEVVNVVSRENTSRQMIIEGKNKNNNTVWTYTTPIEHIPTEAINRGQKLIDTRKGKVYLCDWGRLYILDEQTGKVLAQNTEHNIGAAAVYIFDESDNLYTTSYLAALDKFDTNANLIKTTDSEIWDKGFCWPQSMTFNGNNLIIDYGEEGVITVDKDTFKIIDVKKSLSQTFIGQYNNDAHTEKYLLSINSIKVNEINFSFETINKGKIVDITAYLKEDGTVAEFNNTVASGKIIFNAEAIEIEFTSSTVDYIPNGNKIKLLRKIIPENKTFYNSDKTAELIINGYDKENSTISFTINVNKDNITGSYNGLAASYSSNVLGRKYCMYKYKDIESSDAYHTIEIYYISDNTINIIENYNKSEYPNASPDCPKGMFLSGTYVSK